MYRFSDNINHVPFQGTHAHAMGGVWSENGQVFDKVQKTWRRRRVGRLTKQSTIYFRCN